MEGSSDSTSNKQCPICYNERNVLMSLCKGDHRICGDCLFKLPKNQCPFCKEQFKVFRGKYIPDSFYIRKASEEKHLHSRESAQLRQFQRESQSFNQTSMSGTTHTTYFDDIRPLSNQNNQSIIQSTQTVFLVNQSVSAVESIPAQRRIEEQVRRRIPGRIYPNSLRAQQAEHHRLRVQTEADQTHNNSFRRDSSVGQNQGTQSRASISQRQGIIRRSQSVGRIVNRERRNTSHSVSRPSLTIITSNQGNTKQVSNRQLHQNGPNSLQQNSRNQANIIHNPVLLNSFPSSHQLNNTNQLRHSYQPLNSSPSLQLANNSLAQSTASQTNQASQQLNPFYGQHSIFGQRPYKAQQQENPEHQQHSVNQQRNPLSHQNQQQERPNNPLQFNTSNRQQVNSMQQQRTRSSDRKISHARIQQRPHSSNQPQQHSIDLQSSHSIDLQRSH